MSIVLSGIKKVARVFEMEGTLGAEGLVLKTHDDGYAYVEARTTDGEFMHLPVPSGLKASMQEDGVWETLSDEDKALIESIDESRTYDYRVTYRPGSRIAVRSFIVPVLEKGKVVPRKRYSFDESADASLANCKTRDEFLASAYKGKPNAKQVAAFEKVGTEQRASKAF